MTRHPRFFCFLRAIDQEIYVWFSSDSSTAAIHFPPCCLLDRLRLELRLFDFALRLERLLCLRFPP